jgi:hypothetical protein
MEYNLLVENRLSGELTIANIRQYKYAFRVLDIEFTPTFMDYVLHELSQNKKYEDKNCKVAIVKDEDMRRRFKI